MESVTSSSTKSTETLIQELTPVIAELAGCPVESVVPKAMLQRDLGMDSLGIVELTMKIEETYPIEIPDDGVPGDMSVAGVAALVADRLRARGIGQPAAPGAPGHS